MTACVVVCLDAWNSSHELQLRQLSSFDPTLNDNPTVRSAQCHVASLNQASYRAITTLRHCFRRSLPLRPYLSAHQLARRRTTRRWPPLFDHETWRLQEHQTDEQLLKPNHLHQPRQLPPDHNDRRPDQREAEVMSLQTLLLLSRPP